MPSYDISTIMKQMEDDLIASMVRNLNGHELEEAVEGFKWEQWQAKKLRELVKYQKRNRSIVGSVRPKLNTLVKDLLKNQYLEGGEKTDKEFSSAIKKGLKLTRKHPSDAFFDGDNKKLNALINAVNSDMEKAEYAALRKMDDVYRSTIFRAEMFAGSGTKTVAQAIDMANKDFLSRGIDCIKYSNGAKVNITSYTTMAVRTANKRAHLMGEGERRKEWGESLVLVSQYGQCSPLCKPWQGRVYIDDVYSGGKATDGPYPLLSEAIAGHLFHPHCRHTMSTYFEDITEKPELMTPDNRKYERASKKAEAKRNARKYERLKNGSFDEGNAKKYEGKEKQWDRVANKAKGDIIYEKDINIHRSVGAKAFNYQVKLPNGDLTNLTEGTKITKIYKFAGPNCKRPVKVAGYLAKQYGGNSKDWYHVTGDGYVDVNGVSKKAELHWFECKDVGRIKMKVKRWRDES